MCVCEINKYLKNILGNSVVTCDQIIDAVPTWCDEPTKVVPKIFNKKRQPVQQKNSKSYLPLYLTYHYHR